MVFEPDDNICPNCGRPGPGFDARDCPYCFGDDGDELDDVAAAERVTCPCGRVVENPIFDFEFCTRQCRLHAESEGHPLLCDGAPQCPTCTAFESEVLDDLEEALAELSEQAQEQGEE